MTVKYLRYLFNLESLYPKLHLTVGGWEGGRVTVWTRFYLVHWELPLGCPSRGTRSREQGQTLALEARGEAGEEQGGKTMSIQKGKGTWDFPPECMLQGRRLK